MKKTVCLVIAVCLIIASVSGYAAITYTLPEKMNKQLTIGSGLKGSFTVAVNGDTTAIESFSPFLNKTFQIRGLASGDEFHYNFYQDTAEAEKNALSEVYGTESGVFLRSDLLDGKVFRLMSIDELIDRFTTDENANPSVLSALWRFRNISESDKETLWMPLFRKYEGKIERWLTDYSSGTVVKKTDTGTNVMEMSYSIPFNDIPDAIMNLVGEFLKDEQAVMLLTTVLNDDQSYIYMNRYLDYYYQEALNALSSDQNIVLTRTVSTLGETVSSHIELPLAMNRTGYTSLIIETKDDLTKFICSNNEQVTEFAIEDEILFENGHENNIWINRYPLTETENGTERTAMHIIITKSSNVTTDDDEIDHQNDSYSVNIVHDISKLPEEEKEKEYKAFDPYTIEASVHYFSKYAQSSPTSVEINASFTSKDLKLELHGDAKTCSPWAFSPFEIGEYTDCRTLKDEEIKQILDSICITAKQCIR